jgi:hypothetical protein
MTATTELRQRIQVLVEELPDETLVQVERFLAMLQGPLLKTALPSDV